jgi:hypothetical protein
VKQVRSDQRSGDTGAESDARRLMRGENQGEQRKDRRRYKARQRDSDIRMSQAERKQMKTFANDATPTVISSRASEARRANS